MIPPSIPPLIDPEHQQALAAGSAGILTSLLIWDKRVTWRIALASSVAGLSLVYLSATEILMMLGYHRLEPS